MFKKTPPYLSIPIFYSRIFLKSIYTILSGTLSGVLLISIGVYFFSMEILSVRTMSLGDLVMFFYNQTEATKNIILGSFITLVGFFIAYSGIIKSIRTQAITNIQIQSADELNDYLCEILKSISDIKTYMHCAIDDVNQIQKNIEIRSNSMTRQKLIERVSRNLGYTANTKISIENLRVATMGHGRIIGKYGLMFISTPGLQNKINNSIDSLSKIYNSLNLIVLPDIDDNEECKMESLVKQVNIQDYLSTLGLVERNEIEFRYNLIAGRDKLLSQIMGYNFWTGVYYFQKRKEICKEAGQIYKNKV